MHFQLQAKEAVELPGFGSICQQDKWIKQLEANSFGFENIFYCNNRQGPGSVLHMKRSQSPPTSASTLSSFNGGAAGTGGEVNSTGNINTTAATIAPLETTVPSNNKEEWVTELQPIPIELDLVPGGAMLSESAVPMSQDHSLLRWFAGDVDDPFLGFKQLLQSGSNGLDFEGNAGLRVADQGPGSDPIASLACFGIGNANSSAALNLGGFPGSGFVPNANNNQNVKIGSVSQSCSFELVNNRKVLGATVGFNNNIQDPNFTSTASNFGIPDSLPTLYQQQHQVQYLESQEGKSQILIGQQQHPQIPNFFFPLPQEQQLLQPLLKRLNPGNLELSSQTSKLPFSDAERELFMRKQQQQHMGFSQGVQYVPQQQLQLMVERQKVLGPGEENAQQQIQQATLFDQLYKAAELVGTGNFSQAQLILARLNHQVSPVGMPSQRAAFYFKEALQLLLLMHNPVSPPPPRNPTPFDVIFKMGAYKVFSEVSPLIQFINFTCNQALLEALDGADQIHIVDFDIGFGAQWASFMQELPMRSGGAPMLKITAFVSPSTHHPIELELMRENLVQFANEIGINFELLVLNFDYLVQTRYPLPIFRSSENEAVAVNLPIWSSSIQPSALPNLMHFLKQLSPKIVVSLDQGCDRNGLTFPQHVIHAFQSYINLLESLDASDVTSDAVNKIERFLLVPRIENALLGRLQVPEKIPLWKTLFSSAGLTPVTFSNFTETQADCVVKRSQVRGFHVEKRRASLVLCWQQRDLISASAWRC
ncbi:Scarecrow-like protein 6 [Hibiscus syriacus]|uniref:Scarecrow-like protein 6 n=1 Tax=Hibiscus syriacus TaxID=106335 RepID=A0A6A2XTY5_HIBSY|nr:scarecrow-like protein 22 [Hibiscus syriacus]KAE8661809.1 Scarecrow-like protein 6 [Hibiscus syriacus]